MAFHPVSSKCVILTGGVTNKYVDVRIFSTLLILTVDDCTPHINVSEYSKQKLPYTCQKTEKGKSCFSNSRNILCQVSLSRKTSVRETKKLTKRSKKSVQVMCLTIGEVNQIFVLFYYSTELPVFIFCQNIAVLVCFQIQFSYCKCEIQII